MVVDVTEFAPAKVNLALHVTGRRDDGYHLLDSLVAFAGVGDRVTLRADTGLSLVIGGPRAADLPSGDDNLVLRAARAMGGAAAITLEKVLPVASGIGGGSADAAATLRALARLGRGLPADGGLSLGADVPVCLRGRAARMTGVGEHLAPLSLPRGWLVLVNPGVALSTPAVFRAMARRDLAPLPATLPHWPDAGALAGFLAGTRNDLEVPAITLAPVIAAVRAALQAQPDCLLARMSGSGATCFGLFAEEAAARAAADGIGARAPGWWTAAAPILR